MLGEGALAQRELLLGRRRANQLLQPKRDLGRVAGGRERQVEPLRVEGRLACAHADDGQRPRRALRPQA